MENKMILNAEDEEIERLKYLHQGDKVYTTEYHYDGNKGKIDVIEFEFFDYKRNETDVEVSEGIPVILIDPVHPNVKIPTDLSTSWYLSPRTAVESFREAINDILLSCDEWLKSQSGSK